MLVFSWKIVIVLHVSWTLYLKHLLVVLSGLVLLIIIGRHNFLLSHALVEFFCAAIAWAIFLVYWNSRQLVERHSYVFFAVAYLFVGAFELLHVLTYPGTGIINFDGNTAAVYKIWLAARCFELCAYAGFCMGFNSKIAPGLVLFSFSILAAYILLSVFIFNYLPFPVYLDQLSIAAFVCTILLLFLRRKLLQKEIFILLLSSLLLTLLSVFIINREAPVNDWSSITGHYLEFVSHYLLYLALISVALRRPLTHMFEELNASQEALQKDIIRREENEKRLIEYKDRLQDLASQLGEVEESERRYVAEILHDGVVQYLAVASLKTKYLLDKNLPANIHKVICDLAEILEEAISSSRTLLFEVRPPVLYELGLLPALDTLLEDFKEKHGLDIKVTKSGWTEPEDPALRVLFFKAIRELLLNVVKHSGTLSAEVVLKAEGKSSFELKVIDFGKGFSVENSNEIAVRKTKSYGLFALEERVKALGASLNIDSVPNERTVVSIKVKIS